MRIKKYIQRPIATQTSQKKFIVEGRVNGGIVTAIDSADIPNNALQVAKNLRVRLDKLGVREGSYTLDPTKPNSNSVLNVYSFKKNDGSTYTLRFTKAGVHKRSSSWIGLTGALTGTDTDRFSIAVAFNQCVFANGVDNIKQIDLGVSTVTNLGNAPKYKFVTVFYNRVIGANFRQIGSENPVQIGWSGDGVITEWDPLVNISAGSTPLIESPGDFSDNLTGVYGFTDVMIILREKSIWLASKNPSGTDPFKFFGRVGGKGCTAPYSSVVIPHGVAYVDPRTRKINIYSPEMNEPESIGDQIKYELFSSIADPNNVIGSYDTRYDEYSVLVQPTGTTWARVWVYNFQSKAWTYDERQNISCVNDIDTISRDVMIDDLIGFSEDLTGYIDSLGGVVDGGTTKVYGKTDGDIIVESPSYNTDGGVTFESEVITKEFNYPVETQSFIKAKFEFNLLSSGSIDLYYSKDFGKTWIYAKGITYTDIGLNVFVFQKNLRSRKLSFKLVSQSCKWELLDYEIHSIGSGEIKDNI